MAGIGMVLRRHHQVRVLLAAEMISLLCDQLSKVALMLLVLHLTGSPAASGAVYALTYLPQLIAAPMLSYLADRYPRRDVLATSYLIQGVLVGVMAVLVGVAEDPLVVLVGLCVLIVGGQFALVPGRAAATAFLRDAVVVRQDYAAAVAARQVVLNLGPLAGFAAAGALVPLIGPVWSLMLDALSFLAAALLVLRGLPRQEPAVVPGQPTSVGVAGPGTVWANWGAGLRVVRTVPGMARALGLALLAGFAVVPEGVAAPLAAELAVGPWAVPLILAADPAGYVLGTWIQDRLGWDRQQRWMPWLAMAMSVPLILFVFSPGLGLTLVLLTASGVAAVYQNTAQAQVGDLAPVDARGATAGIARAGLQTSQGLGVALGGIAAEALGSSMSAIALAGLLGLVTAVLIAKPWSGAQRGVSGTSAI
ncbi:MULTISPECIES: MFS transporter [unclassified Crossiella]|uniref:MFS transporter n=1 Tax=unclassified Crossiella TaxID=2620835 RepID=UPI001FFFB2A4|nr:MULTISPECIES: MFS transporter [unclassified Crossiella]MCK2239968.1 MFS transporter [Crossiella sp. S99.2]MCK2252676.1 MFS transporter [Crossiella sp. S99.1]